MSSSKNLEFKKTAFLNKSNNAFIEEMYLKFVNNDPELPDSWRKYFREVGDEDDIIVNEINGPSWSPSKKVSINKKENFENQITEQNNDDIIKSNTNSIKAVAMIRSYRQRGHLIAKLDPLGLLKSDYLEELVKWIPNCLPSFQMISQRPTLVQLDLHTPSQMQSKSGNPCDPPVSR